MRDDGVYVCGNYEPGPQVGEELEGLGPGFSSDTSHTLFLPVPKFFF